MGKIRIYELSRKIKVGNREIIDELEKRGLKGKTHSSTLDPELVTSLEETFKKRSQKRYAPEKTSTAEKVKKKEKEGKKAKETPSSAKPPAPHVKMKEEKKKTAKKAKKAKPESPAEEEDIALPDKLKKEIEEQKDEKLKTKSMQRAFQAIRKIEPKRWVDHKSSKKFRGRHQHFRRGVTSAQPPTVSTAAPRKKAIKLPEGTTIKEFSELIGQKVSDVIKKFMELGSMVTINLPIDLESAILIADIFGVKVEPASIEEIAPEVEEAIEENQEDLTHRAPVVTVMGHVDHGKTSLLDAIRKSRVTESEAGGITQHIGAYKVNLKGRDIVFLDTPGHEAFTTMRARGAQVTDIVVLVVAADDGVMPQTIEAINHAKSANVPIIIAVNKIDKPNANPQKVRTELAEYDIVPEEWGGKNIFVDVSAKQKTGIDDLLEMIILQSEIMELKANTKRPARGVTIESRLDRGRGPVATVLVQSGTLRIGDTFISGSTYGKVRALIDDRGKRVTEAIPSTPVEVIGFSEVPQAGDQFVVVEDERKARQTAMTRQHKERLAEMSRAKKVKLDKIFSQIQEGEIKELNIIIKADVQGSVEALKSSLEKITHPEVKIRVIHTSAGGINESDVMLAAASNAIIIGFNVRPEPKATHAAEREGVDIRPYTVIYEAIDDMKKALEGMLEPTLRENVIGRAEVRNIFSISRIGTIAGCYVLDGTIKRASDGIRVLRDNIVVYQGRIGSLKRFKEDVREVQTGYECGILVENFNDIKVGDILENFEIEKIAATL
ncbi:translation initiation factor IF-2 [bacterium BMS3Bbin06]|nr:translation initiation factor IF-2 [bacterium BMS3Abin08]GBE33670.1 translation initiation factor IF-2 [bacterium BMS3Bbin06]